MITSVPAPQEYRDAGIEYLNLAWDDALHVESVRHSWKLVAGNEEPSAAEALAHMEQRARKRLSVCASLVHQAAELLVKHDIALVSPYLLLDQPAKAAGARDDNVEFGALKTVDSQLLRQLHDRASGRRLSDAFWAFFEGARKRRNGFMHGVGSTPPRGLELAAEVVSLTEMLLGQPWPEIRRKHVLADPVVQWDYHGAVSADLNEEFGLMLAHETFRRHVGLSEGEKTFFCALCRRGDIEHHHPAALLRGNRISCLVCGKTSEVAPVECTRCGASTGVEDVCVSCGGWIDL